MFNFVFFLDFVTVLLSFLPLRRIDVFIYIAPQLPHMTPQRRCRHRQSRRTAKASAQARRHGLWPVAIQQYSPSLPF